MFYLIITMTLQERAISLHFQGAACNSPKVTELWVPGLDPGLPDPGQKLHATMVTMPQSTKRGEGMLLPRHAKFKDSRYDVRILKTETACQISLRSYIIPNPGGCQYQLVLRGRGGVYTPWDSQGPWRERLDSRTREPRPGINSRLPFHHLTALNLVSSYQVLGDY